MVLSVKDYLRSKWLWAVFVIIVVAGGFYLGSKLFKQDDNIYFIAGKIENISGDRVDIRGGIFLNNQLIGSSDELFSLKVKQGTPIERSTFEMPTGEEMFDPGKLPLDISSVDMKAVEHDFNTAQHIIGIGATAKKKINGWDIIRIEYRFPYNKK